METRFSRSVEPIDCRSSAVSVPRIYYLHPWIGGSGTWLTAAGQAAELGFSHLLLAWPFGSREHLFSTTSLSRIDGQGADEVLEALASQCRQLELEFWIDLSIGEIAANGELAEQAGALWRRPARQLLDPRTISSVDVLVPALDEADAAEGLVDLWSRQILHWQALGVSGVRCHDAKSIPLPLWDAILKPAKQAAQSFRTFAWVPEASHQEKTEFGHVFEFVPSSVAWWNGVEPWLVDEYDAVSAGTKLIGFPDNPFAARRPAKSPSDPARQSRLSCADAALLADGWLLPMGYEYGMETPFLHATTEDFLSAQRGSTDLRAAIRETNRQSSLMAGGKDRSFRPLRLTDKSTAVLRQAGSGSPDLVVLNRDLVNEQHPPVVEHAARLGLAPASTEGVKWLAPGTGAVVALADSRPILQSSTPSLPGEASLTRDRIAIENVRPTVDAGRFPVKRSVGGTVDVTADILCDGHDMLAAELLWRPDDAAEWSRAPMRLLGNDRWQGEFPLLRIGRHAFAVQAWWSEFGTYRRDLQKKLDAGLDVNLELLEGQHLLRKFADAAQPADRLVIEDHLHRLGSSQDESAAVLLADTLADAMARADPRPHATGAEAVFMVEADREAASFSSWYELFPRSITDSASRHGSLSDVADRLPAIKAMGFDVLYFPPIHPIGTTNRKGRNNTLTPSPDDPGSPYAIGSSDGGHEAIHPQLGSIDDFRRLVGDAARHGLEIALDFAIQCSPDHPWLTSHPAWFSWRPDGSMRYAENPPKKYQDIVNVDFYAPESIPDLWFALRDVVQGWVDEGVRLFRVDNPHTKPFPFWEWLIADIRSRDPGVIFLAEAFTRPKIMYRLGKVGFSQSYTYFTWRNTKAELTEYLTELNSAPARDIYRPHFFVNTPDINPVFLQHSGRPGFLIRAALAATLSGLWGVYSGFELCEAAAIPGKEEYLDSEKYEIKPRDWQAPGNIIGEITRLNRIRRSHPALQSHLGLTFYNAFNENVLYFGKRIEAEPELILVAVNLDPHQAQRAGIEVPLWEFGLPDEASVEVEDLMRGHRFEWHGKDQIIALEPWDLPFAIWRIRDAGESL